MKPAVAALLVLTACAGWKPRLAYLKVHDAHSDRAMVRRDLGNALTLHGTYLAPSLRDAIAAERKRLMDPTEVDHEAFVRLLSDDGAAYHEVVFTAESNLYDAPEVSFGASDATWKIRLLADGVEQPLVTVFNVDTPNTVQRAIYANTNEFNTLWIARFEKRTPVPASLVLKVGSGLGNTELTWSGDRLK